jgi:hypothetical protein
VLECLYSADTEYRAVLTLDARGVIRVNCEKWITSERWDGSNFAHWLTVGEGLTITDTIENARVLARERLTELGAAV